MTEKISESDPHHNAPELIWIGTRFVHPAEIEFCNLYTNPRKMTAAEADKNHSAGIIAAEFPARKYPKKF